MKWPKDRRKAFLWTAEAFWTPDERRTERQKDLTRGGFCFAIKRLTDSESIYRWVSTFGDQCGIGSAWWWPVGRIHDKQRSLFCCLMAALSDKEFEELIDDEQE